MQESSSGDAGLLQEIIVSVCSGEDHPVARAVFAVALAKSLIKDTSRAQEIGEIIRSQKAKTDKIAEIDQQIVSRATNYTSHHFLPSILENVESIKSTTTATASDVTAVKNATNELKKATNELLKTSKDTARSIRDHLVVEVMKIAKNTKVRYAFFLGSGFMLASPIVTAMLNPLTNKLFTAAPEPAVHNHTHYHISYTSSELPMESARKTVFSNFSLRREESVAQRPALKSDARKPQQDKQAPTLGLQ